MRTLASRSRPSRSPRRRDREVIHVPRRVAAKPMAATTTVASMCNPTIHRGRRCPRSRHPTPAHPTRYGAKRQIARSPSRAPEGVIPPIGVVLAVSADDIAAVDQTCRQATGEVVVTGPRVTQCRGARCLPQRTDGTHRCEAGHGLDDLTYPRARHFVVAVPPLWTAPNQSSVEQTGRRALAVDGATPASAASTEAGKARPSVRTSRIAARAGSAIAPASAARSASPRAAWSGCRVSPLMWLSVQITALTLRRRAKCHRTTVAS